MNSLPKPPHASSKVLGLALGEQVATASQWQVARLLRAAVQGWQGNRSESRLLQISFYTKNSTRKIQTRVPQRNFYLAKGISLSPLSQSHLPRPAGSTQRTAMDLAAPGSPLFQLSPSSFILVQARTQNPTASTILHAHSTSLHLL